MTPENNYCVGTINITGIARIRRGIDRLFRVVAGGDHNVTLDAIRVLMKPTAGMLNAAIAVDNAQLTQQFMCAGLEPTREDLKLAVTPRLRVMAGVTSWVFREKVAEALRSKIAEYPGLGDYVAMRLAALYRRAAASRLPQAAVMGTQTMRSIFPHIQFPEPSTTEALPCLERRASVKDETVGIAIGAEFPGSASHHQNFRI
jgi:hypothetical protein